MLLVVSGSQWGALRSYAWISMAIDYSQQMGVLDAVSKAVDGSDPCHVCLYLSSTKETDSETKYFAGKDRLDFRNEFEPIRLLPVRVFADANNLFSLALTFEQAPPIPPPREV